MKLYSIYILSDTAKSLLLSTSSNTQLLKAFHVNNSIPSHFTLNVWILYEKRDTYPLIGVIFMPERNAGVERKNMIIN